MKPDWKKIYKPNIFPADTNNHSEGSYLIILICSPGLIIQLPVYPRFRLTSLRLCPPFGMAGVTKWADGQKAFKEFKSVNFAFQYVFVITFKKRLLKTVCSRCECCIHIRI